MSDRWTVNTPEQIEEVLGDPLPGVADKIGSALDPVSEDFLRHSPLVLVSTVDAEGRLDVSPKGDAPGFCHVEDVRTLLIPDRKGNRLAYGFRNLLQTGRIGLLFLLPGARETLRINGSAELTRDPAVLERLSAQGKPALLATRVHIEECFLHCGKALIRSELWQPEKWREAPDVSFGRQAREKALAQGKPAADAERGREIVNQLAEQAYRDELY